MAKRKTRSSGAQQEEGAQADTAETNEAAADQEHDQKHNDKAQPAQTFDISYKDKSIHCEKRGTGPTKLIFTHGAGGGLDSPAIHDFAVGFAETSSIVSFKGNMNLRSRTLFFKAVMEDQHLTKALGGRSMGARAAVMAKDDSTQTFILVSYPLIGDKNKEHRDQILVDLDKHCNVLFIIGDNDNMCPLQDLNDVRTKMSAQSWLMVVKGMISSYMVCPS